MTRAGPGRPAGRPCPPRPVHLQAGPSRAGSLPIRFAAGPGKCPSGRAGSMAGRAGPRPMVHPTPVQAVTGYHGPGRPAALERYAEHAARSLSCAVADGVVGPSGHPVRPVHVPH